MECGNREYQIVSELAGVPVYVRKCWKSEFNETKCMGTILTGSIRFQVTPDGDGESGMRAPYVCMTDYSPSKRVEIRIWEYKKAPKALRERVDAKSEWLVLVPPSLITSGIEGLILRWRNNHHPVLELRLPDGSLLFAGTHPSVSMMTIEIVTLTAQPTDVRAHH
jgi:hypothetical protein